MQTSGIRYIYQIVVCRIPRVLTSKLHVKFFSRRHHHHHPGYPKSRPVRRIKDCFASFLQKNTTPPSDRSYWSPVYINVSLWHASTARWTLIRQRRSVNQPYAPIQVIWAEWERKRGVSFTIPAGVFRRRSSGWRASREAYAAE